VLLLTPPGNSAAGRSRTCIGPFRRRMPRLVRPRQQNGQRGRTCTCAPSVPSRGCCSYTTRWKPQNHPHERPGSWGTRSTQPWPGVPRRDSEDGGPEGACTLNPPADDGALCFELRVQKWWEVLVTLQSSLPALFGDTAFTVRQPDHFPGKVAGVGVAPTEAEFMRLA
jgi:hypothetical protein